MQVFSLLGHVIRSGRVVSRLLDAETANIEAARRRDALARWWQTIADGLTASTAAKAWASRALGEQSRRRSSRPHRRRWKNWPSALMQAVERLRRADELTAMWVTDEGHEAMRDLVRARAAVETLRVHRPQESAFSRRAVRIRRRIIRPKPDA
jgi:hypothetical protein